MSLPAPPALPRLLAAVLALLMVLPGSGDLQPQAVVEHLRLKVPASARAAWLEAERSSWEPWLQRQSGFRGRELLWDPGREEGILLIRWASREAWHAIPAAEVARVQEAFEASARQALGARGPGNPFPLRHAGELHLVGVTEESGAA
ncbi:MAG: TIGR03792 family protein [Synechococcaceae cyanobacterium]|nr:TIGR03792 family protein [Synechococcaceae cyanobacterium]